MPEIENDNAVELAAELARVRKELTDANAEAARYRVEKKDAVEAAKSETEQSFATKIQDLEAKLLEETGNASASRTEVTKLKVALATGIAKDKVADFAELLNGDTPEALASHAEKLEGLFTTDESPTSKTAVTDPTQGTGSVVPLNDDRLLNSVVNLLNR